MAEQILPQVHAETIGESVAAVSEKSDSKDALEWVHEEENIVNRLIERLFGLRALMSIVASATTREEMSEAVISSLFCGARVSLEDAVRDALLIAKHVDPRVWGMQR